ncbi:hypothetical protein CP335_08520 [Pseudomonas fluorescens]|uniref:Uncharacterized protein n=1 Tax=Pseudomonas fluorescens TaxID=294 RepID=A0A854XE67_PSEFL|nr:MULTISPECIES: hypothetical protein [Pseudomonas]PCM50232.1 hypothetical protein CP335_08520 [Pseudomonas fluorescens]
MRKSSPLHDLPALPAPPRFDEREGPIEVEADASLRYVILGGLQQNAPNLSPLAQALNHRFAVMFTGNFEERLVGVFGEIRDMGGLSPVKLVGVSEYSMYVVLDERASSTTVQKIAAIWAGASLYLTLPHKICFASENDLWSDGSDFAHLIAAKEIFDSNLLGVWPAPGVHPELEVIEQSALAHPQPSPTPTPERLRRMQCAVAPIPEDVARNLRHATCAMTDYYLKSGAEFGHEQRKKLLAHIALSSGLRQQHLTSVTTSNFNHRPSDHMSDHTGE